MATTDLALDDGAGGALLGGFSESAFSDGLVLRCGCASCLKSAGITQERTMLGETLIIGVAGDDVGDDTTTTATLEAMEGQTIQSAINHPGDVDYFRVGLSAGQTYEFTLAPEVTQTGGADLKIGIYDANGVLIREVDGGGMGGKEEFDFTPDTDGTYYLAVSSFTPADIGNYSITAKLNDDGPNPNAGTPLESLDWGGTANRVNTDGVTNAQGAQVVHVYFSKAGEVYTDSLGPSVAQDWQPFEIAAAMTAFQQYENVINVDFVVVNSREEADFLLVASPTAPVLLGRMAPPGEPNEGTGVFNTAGVGWNEAGLAQGGYGYVTLIHEFGHGMGLAHPHDTGGGSAVMQGVAEDSDPGVFNLNQGVYTTMSYRSGNPDGRSGGSDSDNYGYEGTLGALDIAVLQQKYGANTTFASGNDVYDLKDVNASGTMYSSIWDTGGTDVIRYTGARDAVIDLRAATLKYEEGGGGRISDVTGVFGGFTIANGVLIENAQSGTGNDRLTGNDAANRLDGGAGLDSLFGAAGADTLFGRDGNDSLSGGADSDLLRGELGNDRLFGDEGRDRLFGDAGNDVLVGGAGGDRLSGGAGADRFMFLNVSDSAAFGADRDRIEDFGQGDLIDLRGIDASTAGGRNDVFTFVTRFSDTAGELMVRNADGYAVVLGDVDGDGEADFGIFVVTNSVLEANDFLL